MKETVIRFHRVRDDTGSFSSFAPAPIEVRGVVRPGRILMQVREELRRGPG